MLRLDSARPSAAGADEQRVITKHGRRAVTNNVKNGAPILSMRKSQLANSPVEIGRKSGDGAEVEVASETTNEW